MFIIPEMIMRTKLGIVYTQIAIFRWANVAIVAHFVGLTLKINVGPM
jgi:hypothetical protein